MSTDAPCEYLEWDSDFFGRRIARVTVEQVNEQAMGTILEWCRNHAIDCLYFLADPSDAGTLKLLATPMFKLVDLRITFEHQLTQARSLSAPDQICCRPFQAADLPVLRDIAGKSYTDSRFYFDGNFPDEACDRLYKTWLEKSCHGYADMVLVAEIKGTPAGFITGDIRETTGQIGLVGVANAARGQGIGRQLMLSALTWFQKNGCQDVVVVTQGRNIHAQRLYQRCSFLTPSLKLWYHGWFVM